MTERQPFSGKLITLLQNKYTRRRIADGTATTESISEIAFAPLRKYGIIRGFSPAIKELRRYYIEYGITKNQSLAITLVISVGSMECLMTILGIGKTNKSGSWEVPGMKFLEENL